MKTFRALLVTETDTGFERAVVQRRLDDLPDNDVLIKVAFTSINYKDALSAAGHKGITRKYPHTPGIDAAGTIAHDRTGQWDVGQKVVVIGYDLGMNTSGGMAEYISVPADWPITLPDGLTMPEVMVLGTAGATAGYCIEKIMAVGVKPENGPVLVTGATGGVGSLATALLSRLGYNVVASTGKRGAKKWLEALGAAQVIDRDDLSVEKTKVLLPERWAAAVDTIAGSTLVNIIKSLKFNGAVVTCGMITGTDIGLTVFPFILRGVSLLGVASADAGREDRERVFEKLSTQWRLNNLMDLAQVVSLADIPGHMDKMLAGRQSKRVVVDLGKN